MNDTNPRPGGVAVPPECLTVLTVDHTAHLTDARKTWRKMCVLPPDPTGAGLMVATESAPRAEEILPAVAEMLTTGAAGSAEMVFTRLRAAGLALKAVVGQDGVLHVTTVGV